MKRCNTCRKDVMGSASFCPFCGARGRSGPVAIGADSPTAEGADESAGVELNKPWADDDAAGQEPLAPPTILPYPAEAGLSAADPKAPPTAAPVEPPQTMLGYPVVGGFPTADVDAPSSAGAVVSGLGFPIDGDMTAVSGVPSAAPTESPEAMPGAPVVTALAGALPVSELAGGDSNPESVGDSVSEIVQQARPARKPEPTLAFPGLEDSPAFAVEPFTPGPFSDPRSPTTGSEPDVAPSGSSTPTGAERRKRIGRLRATTMIGAPSVALRHLTGSPGAVPPASALADLDAPGNANVESTAPEPSPSKPLAAPSRPGLRELTREQLPSVSLDDLALDPVSFDEVRVSFDEVRVSFDGVSESFDEVSAPPPSAPAAPELSAPVDVSASTASQDGPSEAENVAVEPAWFEQASESVQSAPAPEPTSVPSPEPALVEPEGVAVALELDAAPRERPVEPAPRTATESDEPPIAESASPPVAAPAEAPAEAPDDPSDPLAPAGPSSTELPPLVLEPLLMTVEQVESDAPKSSKSAFKSVGYAFRANRFRRSLVRAGDRLLGRKKVLQQRCDLVATSVGQAAWRRGQGSGELAELRTAAAEYLVDMRSSRAAVDSATSENDAANHTLVRMVTEAQARDLAARQALEVIDGRMSDVVSPMRELEAQRDAARVEAGRLRRGKPEDFEQLAARSDGAAEEAHARALGYRPLIAQVREERAGPAQVQQAALQELSQAQAELERVRSECRLQLKPTIERYQSSRSALKRIETAALSGCRDLGERILTTAPGPAEGEFAKARAQLDADEVVGSHYRDAAEQIDLKAIRRGRLTLLVAILLPIAIAATIWAVLRMEKTRDHGSRVVEAPSESTNLGTSPSALAQRALPAGQPAYFALSVDGLTKAPVLAPFIKSLAETGTTLQSLGKELELPIENITVLVGAGAADSWSVAFASNESPGDIRDFFEGNGGSVKSGDIDAYEAFGLLRAVSDRGGTVIASDADALAGMFGRLAIESTERWVDDAEVASLAEFVDRGATAWGVATGASLKGLKAIAANGDMPRPARRLVRRIQGVAVSLNVAESAHAVVSFQFTDSEQAGEGAGFVEKLISVLRDGISDLPDDADVLRGALGDLIKAVSVEADERYVIVTVAPGSEVTAAVVSAVSAWLLRS